jgi:SsrA-binding protein
MAEKSDPNSKVVAQNRRARYEFHLTDTYEAGIVLTGTEVKSLRKGHANITESYAAIENDGLALINAYIPELQSAGAFFQHAPRRPRRLLLSKREIHKLSIAITRKGMTLVPTEIYFNERGRAKLKLQLAEGKNHADKRDTSAKRDWERQKARLMRDKG